MSQHEFDTILQKYLAGTCTPAEEKIILEWYDTFINQSETPLSSHEKLVLEQKIWSRIEENTISDRPVIRINRSWSSAVAAACIIAIVVLGGYWYLREDKIPGDLAFDNITVPGDYKTAYNKSDVATSITLSDGSRIELQPQSALYFPVRFTGTTRDVYLTGDAFFQVAHDTSKHFIVHTDEGLVTEVLGTSFYILHDKVTNKVEVSVVTGKISVYEQKEKGDEKRTIENRIVLTPNQKVSYKQLNNQFITSLVEEPKPLEQRTGGDNLQSFVFDDAPLLTVLKIVETTYGITIHTEDQKLNSCHFTGDLTRQSLYDKLDIICKSLQTSYEIKGTTIYVRGKGCN